MSWSSRALINCAALQHNLSLAKKTASNSKVLAVIKSNGYGHGITEISTSLVDADAFAVATIDEAILVRNRHPDKTIVVLQGFLSKDELSLFQQYKLQAVIHTSTQLDILESTNIVDYALEQNFWFKIDTGMGRLGFSSDNFIKALNRLEKILGNNSNIILMSHFANADDPADHKTIQQLNLFKKIIKSYHYKKSIANSAGLLAWQESHYDWVRAGIMLYGVSPFSQNYKIQDKLQTVMTLESKLIAINIHKQGDSIGYTGDWKCPEDMNVGVVSIGYGDGYPRQASSGTPVLVNGVKTTIVGRVSMDMICIDLRPIANVEIGTTVTLWGEHLAIEEVASYSKTIAYELLCQVGKRVEFVYL